MNKILSGFRQFILRGNVVDLAIGVVVGASFNSIIAAMVKDLLTPLIAAMFKAPDFSKMSFTLHGSVFMYGDFLNNLIAFFIVAGTVYFFVVVPLNALLARAKSRTPEDPTTKRCPECLSDIPIHATRCAHCTIILPDSSLSRT